MIAYDENELRELSKDSEKWQEVRQQYQALKKLYEQLNDEVSKRNWEEKKLAHKKSLQALKQGAPVWTTRTYINPDIPYGSECRKVSNGAKRMQVVIAGKRWMMPYSDLTDTKPSDLEIQMNRRLKNILTI